MRAPGIPGTFPRHRLQRKPLVSDPGMHYGTCVSHVSWCMSGSLTPGGENVPGIPGACATRNFTYLARGPCSVYKFVTAVIIFQEPTEFVVMWPVYCSVWVRCASSAALIISMCIILYLYRNADVTLGPPRVASVITSRFVATCILNVLVNTVEVKIEIKELTPMVLRLMYFVRYKCQSCWCSGCWRSREWVWMFH